MSFLFVLISPNLEMLSLHWKEERRERVGKQVDVYNYCTAVSCTHWHVKESVLYLIRLEMGTHCRDRRTGVICFETSF